MQAKWISLIMTPNSKKKVGTLPSGVTARGSAGCPKPPTLFTGKFLLTYREKRGKEKRENREEKKENCKREGGKFNMEGESIKISRWPFFSRFLNPLKFVWVYQNGNFYLERACQAEKSDFAPPPWKNIPLTPITLPICVSSYIFIDTLYTYLQSCATIV